MNGLVNDSAYEHPDWTAFVRSIRANPTDSLTRRVAADWLEDHGNAARAGLIRLQCDTNAKPLVGRPGVGLMAMVKIEGRVAEISITPAIPEASLILDRGFVVAAELPWEMWEQCGDRLLRREPVSKVVLTTRPSFTIPRRPRRLREDDARSPIFMLAGRRVTGPSAADDANLSERWPEVLPSGWVIQNGWREEPLVVDPMVHFHNFEPPNPVDDIRAARDRIMRESHGDRYR